MAQNLKGKGKEGQNVKSLLMLSSSFLGSLCKAASVKVAPVFYHPYFIQTPTCMHIDAHTRILPTVTSMQLRLLTHLALFHFCRWWSGFHRMDFWNWIFNETDANGHQFVFRLMSLQKIKLISWAPNLVLISPRFSTPRKEVCGAHCRSLSICWSLLDLDSGILHHWVRHMHVCC